MRKNPNNSRILTWFVCIIISLASIIALLITSCEIAIYGDMDYYQALYEKYDVADDLLMETEDIVYVSQEMMLYLRGDREDLIIETTVNGVEREFFNESEISHMEDVQELFVGGLHLRTMGVIMLIVLFVALVIGKMDWKYILPRAFQYVTAGFVVVVGILGYLFATNFYKYFVIFHELFFEDGTWTFDPSESLMINMLPEGLFYDFTLRIVVVFLSSMVVALILSGVARYKTRRKE